jgi:hypothetical protein
MHPRSANRPQDRSFVQRKIFHEQQRDDEQSPPHHCCAARADQALSAHTPRPMHRNAEQV